ncbi:DNA topoisomerase 3 [Granulosicoccus antarcticus]|uniref:DNA topoisomerase n=1 Tax=Granulosicoccus antarcticus IMCC3135 TaxID=1192854 RepID=A0A2Z2NQC0_9GAMM|nr:DNA topoisomerase 3 [Granulosicoccus antarcticus]ASJ72171.1 DNA topoisomerase 3 [Granulosicoccus antarcticus IMCC3135]
MGRLFIAEKPSVAKAIAAELGKASRSDGYLCCGNDVITWCFGHMLELASPDEYTSDDVPRSKAGRKRWRVDELPIIPDKWKSHPKETARKQLKIMGSLLKRADLTEVVHAGDPDREGQLLVDEVLAHFKNRKPTRRYWVSAQDPVTVRRGLSSLENNSQYQGWASAARARARADWLTGMNLSRAYTLASERSGAGALLTIGRVQTPTLALVVQRDQDIESFVSIPFYTLEATFIHKVGKFCGTWQPADDQAGLDSEGRLLDKAVADSIIAKVQGKQGVVSVFKQQRRSQPHPLAFSLADITLLGSRIYGFSAEETLKACQSLYEKHKLTSYPRTDTGYLPESQFADAPTVLASLRSMHSGLQSAIDGADTAILSRTWNDKQVTAHHGIIPTQYKSSLSALTDTERKLYELIVRRYIAQFYPEHQFMATTIEVLIKAERFRSYGKRILVEGWRTVLSSGHSDKEQALPAVALKDKVDCDNVMRRDAKTKPPARFNEGTLIQAMANIHRYIVEAAQKKVLREGDGIGTSATRASIISELKRRTYLETSGKHIISTTLGRSLCSALPEVLKSAVSTAVNERLLKEIETGAPEFDAFLRAHETFIRGQVCSVNQSAIVVKGAESQQSGKKPKKRQSLAVSKHKCNACSKGLVRRPSVKAKGDWWWGCSGFPECKNTYRDKAGKPVF